MIKRGHPTDAARARAPKARVAGTPEPRDAGSPPHTPATAANHTPQSMFLRDRASRALGMDLLESRPGFARVRMPVREDMLQGHDTCHGGFVFALADSAFAFACNSHGYRAVAAGCSIEYLAPVHLGDLLTAVAQEQALAGRSGVYDVAVTNQHGAIVALFRGRSKRVSD